MAYHQYKNQNYGYGGVAIDDQANQTIGSYNARHHFQTAQNFGFVCSAEEGQQRVLYVGNLDPSVTETFISVLFSQIGRILKVKINCDAGSFPYAFVEFADHLSASQALQAMNKRMLLDREIKVSWVSPPVMQQKVDTSNHFHVFVGDLSPEVDNKALRDAFVPFGEVSDAKVIRDPQTLVSKGYGFVSYPKREQAERGIEQMNGQWLGRRTIRTNWATRKPTDNAGEYSYGRGNFEGGARAGHYSRQTYEEILSQATPDNNSVYVGNVAANVTDADVQTAFKRFGTVVDIRHFKPQGYLFVKFDNKESAARAIHEMNGTELLGQAIRCSWGKSDGTRTQDEALFAALAAFPGATPGAFPTAAQQQQYMQYYQHYYSNPAVQQQMQAYWAQMKAAGVQPNAGPNSPNQLPR